ncbi:hypothetical protein [Levilactobacillus lindianensis]|uniref:hypothetical protein n=1 Tax=Levilactobacillus lindianensis TaxID=2486018 RepID=UPI000F73598A|nr:hypothetical protein [Levilactobacillus lindianensis]
MERKLCSIDVIQVGTEKTIEGFPKDVLLRLGGLELSLTLNGLYATAKGDLTDEQRRFIAENFEMGQQLIKILAAVSKPYSASTYGSIEK